MNCLCYLPDDGPEFERIGIADWPPMNPATYTRHDGFKLIRGASFSCCACQYHSAQLALAVGYLKRKSNKSEWETKWAIRWMEVEPPDSQRPDVMLAVYKTDLREKRLNAVSLRNISSVSINEDEPQTFNVVVGASVYTLLARDEADARKWVATLNENVRRVRHEDIVAPEETGCLLS